MSFFFALFLLAGSLSLSLLFSQKTNVFVSSFFLSLSLCLCVRVSSNSLNEVFLHTQIKKYKKTSKNQALPIYYNKQTLSIGLITIKIFRVLYFTFFSSKQKKNE